MREVLYHQRYEFDVWKEEDEIGNIDYGVTITDEKTQMNKKELEQVLSEMKLGKF